MIVIGGGPAGLATAIHARRQGMNVIVLERRARVPVDKPCGEGLLPSGVVELAKLGVEIAGLGGRPFHGIRFLDGSRIAEGRFPGPPGLGVRRTSLHAALVRLALAEKVELRTGVRVRGISDGSVLTDTGPLRCRWIVGADGLHSRVREWAGLAAGTGRLRRFGARRHFAVEPWSDLVEVYWSDGCEAYVTPVGPRAVGIALTTTGWPRPFDDCLEQFPELVRRLGGCRPISTVQGTGPMRQNVRAVRTHRVGLVGDASGYVDSITGEGLALAFQQARALATAAASGSLDGYARMHRRIVRAPTFWTHLVLALGRRRWSRAIAMRGLHAAPGLFSLCLHLHELDGTHHELGQQRSEAA